MNKEHLNNKNIEDLIKEYVYFRIVSAEKINDKAWKFIFETFSSKIELFIAILGKEKRIEEDIEELRRIFGRS